MCSSKRPSVDGFVSIRPAVRSSTFARRSSKSRLPRSSVSTFCSSKPAMATLAGFVPCAVSADDDRAALCLAAVGEVGAHEHQAGQLALRAGGRLERDRVEARRPRRGSPGGAT